MAGDLVKRFRVKNGQDFKLADYDPDDTAGLDLEKSAAKERIAGGVQRLRGLQEKLYAQASWSLLIILQAMDAAGKDSAVEHVMSGVNPQGCEVTAFKVPSQRELRHDFLWRTTAALPERGRIGIFNRSYYEEVLIVRVHPELLGKQGLPPELVTDEVWNERFEDIRAFERHLTRSGTTVLKFFLNVSKNEQRRRFLDRIDDPDKRWKFNLGDLAERQVWDDYMKAYEDAIRQTATKEAPWHVIPADNKWFSRLAIAETIIETLEKMDPAFPKVDAQTLKGMETAREALLAEEGKAGKEKGKKK